MQIGRFTLQDIRLVWQAVKPCLEAIAQDLAMDWRPEDIYAHCLMGLAFCYTCDEGFIIVQPQENAYTLKKELFVWICYSTASHGLDVYEADIKLIAKDVFAETIVFKSPRKGFHKVAERKQWRSVTEYRMTV